MRRQWIPEDIPVVSSSLDGAPHVQMLARHGSRNKLSDHASHGSSDFRRAPRRIFLKKEKINETTHKVKTQQVVKSRGQHCGDLELAAYLANEAGPVPLVLDLRIAHDRIGSSANPALNGTLTYPNNIDESLNKTADDKIRKYC